MKFIILLILMVFPICVHCDECPHFQAVIPLNPLATTSNFSYAIVADGKYYLMTTQDVNETHVSKVDGSGLMAEGFEKSRLITVFDRSDCNDSQYYLIAIESFRDGTDIQTNYSTLDLKNWSNTTEWSLPESISKLPIIANNIKIHSVLEFGPNLSINDIIHSLFVWEETKTLFVITRSIGSLDSKAVKTLNYYSIDMKESCHQIYSYSKTENLKEAINWISPSLDFCFISELKSDPIIYCLDEKTFEANIIDNQFKNGSLRSHIHISPESLPSISQLYPISLLCNKTVDLDLLSTESNDFDGVNFGENQWFRVGNKKDIGVFIQVIEQEDDFDDYGKPKYGFDEYGKPIYDDEYGQTTSPEILDPSMRAEETEVPLNGGAHNHNQNEDTFSLPIVLIVVVCAVLILSLVFIGIMITARKRNQLARM